MDTPKVTVGIPTYNRAPLLLRAIESVLRQSHRNVEVFVSDNASSDGTDRACQALSDPRLRYVRQPANRGPTANFNAALAGATGEYFMWLSDDDWLDPDYVARCLEVLLRNPTVAVAAGRCKLYGADGAFIGLDEPTNITQADPYARLLAYYATVGLNPVFYGLMRTAQIRKIGMRNMLANDWLAMALMTLHGALVTVETTHVHRVLGGTSKSFERIIEICGLPRYQRYMPQVTCAINIAAPLLAPATWPRPAPARDRRRLAWTAFLIHVLRHTWFRRLMPRTRRHSFVARYATR
jgi:glycosyltransferase involved in cell wall biosynthesis